MLVAQLTLWLLIFFTLDAAINAWRRGDRRQALFVGGGIVFFELSGTVQAILVVAQITPLPFMASLFYLGIVLSMGYELSRDALRAVQLDYDLQESEKRLSLATDAAKLGIWIRDLKKNKIWATDNWRQLFGFTKTDRLTLDLFLQRLYPDDRDGVHQVLTQLNNNHPHYEKEYRILPLDGQTRWIASRGRAEFDGAGKAVLVRGVSVDITHRKQAELELARQRNEVAHLSRVTTLGEISGSLAHELSQPLGAILTNTDAAEFHLKRPAPNLDEVRAILADIRKDDMRAGEIIHGMRAFLRRRELEMQPLETDQLAGDAIRLVSADAVTRKITIGLEIPPVLPRVLGDRIHLQQVLVNLLVNGMDAVDNCAAPYRRITIRTTQLTPLMVEIAGSDAGAGISPEDMKRVFDAFHTTKKGGLGLGLSICRSIVEAHGGTIAIENNLDRGATVRFTLPVRREEPA